MEIDSGQQTLHLLAPVDLFLCADTNAVQQVWVSRSFADDGDGRSDSFPGN